MKEYLDGGRRVLERLSKGEPLRTYDVPNTTIDTTQSNPHPPVQNDPSVEPPILPRACNTLLTFIIRFFVATDETNSNSRNVIASNGAVFLNDLLTREDKKLFGFEIMLTDVRALVEQALLARAGFVYAHGMSSLAGGMVNMRATAGKDPRTVELS